MKKQYMHPEWKATLLEENFIATSGDVFYSFTPNGIFDNDDVESWVW